MLIPVIRCDGPGCEAQVEFLHHEKGVLIPEGWLRDPPYVRGGPKNARSFGGGRIRTKHYCPSCQRQRRKGVSDGEHGRAGGVLEDDVRCRGQ